MRKGVITKCVLTIMTIVMLLSVCSCGNLEKDKLGVIVSGEDNTIVYQGEEYYQLENNIFGSYSAADREARYSDFILLSWNYNFPFTGVIEYYSYSTESPNFIVEPNVEDTVWFKRSFDYQNEIFVIENTEIEVVFSSVFQNSNKIKISNKSYDVQSFYWHAKSYNSLRTQVDIICIDDVYYVTIPNMTEAYQISNDFLHVLVTNGIINRD